MTTSAQFDMRVLNWILNAWPKGKISARDLQSYVRSIPSRDEAIAIAERLAKQGFLVPLPSHRYDRRLWAIVRNPK